MSRRKDTALPVESAVHITPRPGESRDAFLARLTASAKKLSAAERERIGKLLPERSANGQASRQH